MARPTRIFAGERLPALRANRGVRQADFARTLSLSTSYLSQLENDQRPLTAAIFERLAAMLPLDWQAVAADSAELRLAALREANADALFAQNVTNSQLVRFSEQSPKLADRFISLHEEYRRGGRRL